MNRQGPSGQPIRGMPGFPGQPGQIGRATSRGGGSATGWGFGMNGGGQGLNPQGRGMGQSTFAQSVGGQSAPLDLSEFPSLGTSAQPQFQNANPAVWSNQRAAQGQSSRQPPQSAGLGSGQQRSAAQDQLEEAFFPSGAGSSGLDDFRHGDSRGIGQLSMGPQPQSGDEFPPLGRRGELGPDRRMNMMQNAAGGGFGGPAFPSDGQALRSASNSLRLGGHDRTSRGQQDGNESSIFPDLNPSAQLSGHDGNAPESSTVGSPNGAGQVRSQSPIQMSDRDRYGLGGLLKQIRNSDSDPSNLTIGMDLTHLGLDLNSSEPLYPTFAGPFGTAPTRPLQPDFVLPSCYSVTNIHPIEEKIGSLSDETLFYIFYTMPKDVIQEQAAIELTSRNWRYHKILQLWITKEPGYDDPQIISQDVERGRYILFNPHTWNREQREMILQYVDLDDHITTAVPGTLP